MTKTPRTFPLLLILSAGSGCAALIFEIVWYHLLQLAIGSTAVSLGFLLATFMGGLCLGSLFFPRLRLSARHPLRIYAALELGIGILGLVLLPAIPLVSRIYVSGVEHGLPGMLLRGVLASVCMLPPTMLMGASLPAIARWIRGTPSGVSLWGWIYGFNTAGAVLGCLLAGFYLLRLYNVITATLAAAAINAAVALAAYLLAARTPSQTGDEPEPPQASDPVPDLWPVYIVTALSGATALGAEVVWTRLMGMLLGSTVYVFAIILAVFLVGMALGSGIGSWMVKPLGNSRNARLALGWSQFLLTLGIFWGAFMLADSLPYWPVNPFLSTSHWFTFQIDIVRCLWTMLPAALLWGASFPLALAAAAARGADEGRVVGAVYAANTLGAIVGALGVSLVLVPAVGTQNTQRILLALAAIGGLVAFLPNLRNGRGSWLALATGGFLVLSVFLIRTVDKIPGEVIAYGRRITTHVGSGKILYTAEGRNSSVAVSQWSDGAYEIDVNGHVEATTEPYDMKLQRMVGHLPGILHPAPKSVLGIGFGAGVSAGTFTTYSSIEHITVCEIEPLIPPTATRYFARQDYNVLHNPRTRIVYDDARHFLLTTPQKFDIIASDPLDVFVKGTAALYSKEYFESVKRHLNPGGLFSLYVPLYETDLPTIKSELATFFDVFPYGTVWANTVNGQGYDMVFLGQAEPLKIDLDVLDARFHHPDYANVVQSLRDIGVSSPTELLSTYAGRKPDLAPWLIGAEINRDRDLRLQYLAGWGIDSRIENELYREIMKYRGSITDLFTGTPERMQALESAMAAY